MNDSEPWIDKKGLARHLACSVRTVDRLIADGCPHVVMLGRVRVRASEVESWLRARGDWERRGRLPNPQREEEAA